MGNLVVKCIFVVFSCIVFFNAEASEIQTDTLYLSIKDAVDLTLRNNTQIKISDARVDQESAKSSGIWGSLLPKVDFTYGWKHSKDASNANQVAFDGEPYNSYSAGFDFTQPIFRGGALWSGPIAQNAKTEVAELDSEIQKREQLFGMAQSYYSLLLYQEQVATLKRQYDAQSKLISQARQRYRMGAERELTVLQFETQSALLKPQIIAAENNAQSAAVRLLNYIGKSDVELIRVSGSLESANAYKPVAAAEVDFNSRPEIKKLYQQIRGFDAQKAVVMSEHWPSLSVVGRWGQRSFTRSELFSTDSREWNYGLQLSVPIFSGLSSFAKRRELAAQDAELRYQEKYVRDEAGIALIQNEKLLRTAQELVAANKIAFDLARRSYQKASEMFRFGTLPYNQFFDIEKDSINSELAYYASLYDQTLAVMRFHVATGQDLKKLLESLNTGSK